MLLFFNCKVVSDSLWLHRWQHARLPCPSPTPSLLKFMSIELVMPSSYLILYALLLLLPSIFPSIKVFSNELALHIRWPKYWSFSFIISLCNKYQVCFPLGLTLLTSLLSKGLSRVFSVRECLMGGFVGAVSHESFVPLQAEQHAAPRDWGHCVRQSWVSFSKHSLYDKTA